MSHYTEGERARLDGHVDEIGKTLPTRAAFLHRAIEAIERLHDELSSEDVEAFDFIVDVLVDESVRIVRGEGPR